MKPASTLPTVPIVMFHDIGWPRPHSRFRGMTVPWPLFAAYVRRMARAGFRGISVSQLDDMWQGVAPAEAKPAVFTFDDAYVGVHRYAVPILKRHGWSGTIYALSNPFEGRNAWMGSKEGNRRLMTNAQLREAAAAGIEVGSHTISHPHLTHLSEPAAREEIVGSKAGLEGLLEREVRSFAYPYGDHNEEVKAMVRDAGYRTAVSVLPGLADDGSDRFALPRVAVTSWRLGPSGFLRLFQDARHN